MKSDKLSNLSRKADNILLSVKASNLYKPPSSREMEDSIQRNELGNLTIKDLLKNLAILEKSGKKKVKNELTTLYLKFKALIYLHPENCKKIGYILLSALPKSLAFQILPIALGKVGSKEAQLTLIKVIKKHANQWPYLSILIPALGMAKKPLIESENTMRFLTRSKNRNISKTAFLNFGAMAGNLGSYQPERAERIIQEISHILKNTQNDKQKSFYISVLGNTGSASIIPIISPFFNNPSTYIRSKAINSLRLIPLVYAQSILIKALKKDRDKEVRELVVYILGNKKFNKTIFLAHKKAYYREKSVLVRLQLLKNLWNSKKDFPEGEKIVKSAAKKDKSKSIRKWAKILIKVNKSD